MNNFKQEATHTHFDVIVLGAGYTFSTLTAQLSNHEKPGTRILRAGAEATLGLAYGAAAPMHLLKVAAGRMSMWPDKPDDFVRWLLASGYGDEEEIQGIPLAERFIPRAIYGQYVQDRLRTALAETHCQVARRTVQAIRLDRSGAQWRVTFDDGFAATAPTVAICLGSQIGALPLPASAVSTAARDRIIADPWHDPRLAVITPDDRVLVIGTGLTMVDLVMQREHDGHTGQTIAISRRGLLPEDHALHAENGVPTPGIDEPSSLLDLVDLVRGAISERVAIGGDWRPVFDGLRPATQRLWMARTPAEQSRFLRHLGIRWGVARHHMPPIAGQRLAAQQQDGRLEVIAGRLCTISASRGRLDVTLKERGEPSSRHVEVDWVAN